MKKIHHIITQSEFARKLKQSPQFITKLIDAGIIIRRPDGRLDYADALAKATAYLKARAEADALHSGKTALVARRLMLQCELLQAELDQVLGKVHSKEACTQSHAATYAAALTPLLSIGSRIRAKFPEISAALKLAIDTEIDATFDTIREHLKNEPRLFCPHCHQHVQRLEVEQPTNAGTTGKP